MKTGIKFLPLDTSKKLWYTGEGHSILFPFMCVYSVEKFTTLETITGKTTS